MHTRWCDRGRRSDEDVAAPAGRRVQVAPTMPRGPRRHREKMLHEPSSLNLPRRPRYLLAEVALNCMPDVVAKLPWPPLKRDACFCGGRATARCPCRRPGWFCASSLGNLGVCSHGFGSTRACPGRAQPGSPRGHLVPTHSPLFSNAPPHTPLLRCCPGSGVSLVRARRPLPEPGTVPGEG